MHISTQSFIELRNGQLMAKFARDFRCRSNSLRSAYKIARYIAGFKRLGLLQLNSPGNLPGCDASTS